jgi:DNA-binding transcriptional ArsR family regulator
MASFRSMPRRNGFGIELRADPTRRRIITLIAISPRRPSAVARELGVHRSTASRQLHLLEQAGLIMGRQAHHDRRGVLYMLDPRRVGHVLAWLAGTEMGGPFTAAPRPAPSVTSPSEGRIG